MILHVFLHTNTLWRDSRIVQALEDEFNGWLDERIVKKFTIYAEVCFLNFGDRVKDWLTFNEPLTFVNLGYSVGMHAPGRCSDRSKCDAGDSATEPYIAGHNVLRAHARAVQVYRELKQVRHSRLGEDEDPSLYRDLVCGYHVLLAVFPHDA